MFIKAASTISYQPTFRNPGFSASLTPLTEVSKLSAPDYTGFIAAMDRRRMSDIQKMSITCAMDCLTQAEIQQPDAVIVGTSMGCSVNIKTFLDKIIEANEGPLSPTSFIVSTHNTVAGQIALLLKNHGYNMTYTQNTLSFEQGLIDAMISCKEGMNNVLVGGADEEEESIYNMHARLNDNNALLSSGASFFLMSNQHDQCRVRVVDVGSFGWVENNGHTVNQFLQANNTTIDEVDLTLFAIDGKQKELPNLLPGKLIDYQQFAGTYYTSSAFALHYAFDILLTQLHSNHGDHVKTILVYNNLLPENLGLILLTSKTD
ncbi:MAG: beta-ketoacyl synthase chain length factor [Flavisolibacter sp.]